MQVKETPWFYHPDLAVEELLPMEARHAVSVLRLRERAAVHVTTGKGQTAEAEVIRIHKGQVWLNLGEIVNHPEQVHKKTLVVGQMHQPDRLEWLVEKVQELGLSHLIICKMERSAPAKLSEDRLQRIAHSALKQSHQAWLTRLSFCQKIEDALTLSAQPIAFGYLPPLASSQVSVLASGSPFASILIGPESDFSEKEVALLLREGSVPISLGPARLRTETAALAAAVFLQI